MVFSADFSDDFQKERPIERLLNGFVFADAPLRHHPQVSAAVFVGNYSNWYLEATTKPTKQGLRWSRGRKVDNIDFLIGQKPGPMIYESNPEHQTSSVWSGLGVGSVLVIPLVDGGAVIGALSFDAMLPHFFGRRHLEQATLLGVLVSYLLWNPSDKRSSPSSRSVGSALRQVRESLGLTQEELAARMSMGRITLSAMESGSQPASAGRLMIWCTALGLVGSHAVQIQRVDVSERILGLLKEDADHLMRLTPEEFEHFVAGRVERMGYDVELTKGTNVRDGGIDLIAIPKLRTAGSFLLAGQVKHHADENNKTGRPSVDRLLAWKESHFRTALLVTNTSFTRDARWLADQVVHKPFLRLRDFEDLKRWIREDYTSEFEWREIPESIELASGISIQVPKPRIVRVGADWPVPPFENA